MILARLNYMKLFGEILKINTKIDQLLEKILLKNRLKFQKNQEKYLIYKLQV